MTKIAIIDMGTNTFHLLVAEVTANGYCILHRDHDPVKIGKGGINEGFIPESAYSRALEAICRFRKIIDRFDVGDVHAFGTSAFRNAVNGSALASEITARTGIPVHIISGDEEATYIFEGIKAAMSLGSANNLIVDIGAGSVEFIIGDDRQILWKQSVEIGGQRLVEKFQKHDPILPAEIQALECYFEKSLQDLLAALNDYAPEVLIGSSGTFDTLSEIYCFRNGIRLSPDTPETPLSAEAFSEIYFELISKNREERMQIKGMAGLRVDLIVVGCCLIRFLLGRHTFGRIRVSRYSLKEGALAKFASSYRDS